MFFYWKQAQGNEVLKVRIEDGDSNHVIVDILLTTSISFFNL